MILAATMITALFLITPVCWAYNPPSGGGGSDGGSSGGSSSGSASAAGSGENTYSSTASSGTWTPVGDGLNQVVFRNSPTPVSTITIKVPAPESGTPPAQLPAFTVSVMSGINTNKLINTMQETPGSGAVTAGGTPLFYQGMAKAAAMDPSYQNAAVNYKKFSRTKVVPVLGLGYRYDITPKVFAKLEYNYAFRTTIVKQTMDSQGASIKLQTHKIKTGVGFRL
jgi:opacity protein-like surface antigen